MSRTLDEQRQRAAWWFLTPTLVVLALVALWPLVRTIALSFTDAHLGTRSAPNFVGLANYLGEDGLLGDPRFLEAARNTILFAIVSVALETAMGLGVALILHRPFHGRGLVRALVLVPWAIPTVVSAQMWKWMFHDVFGVVNDALLRLGVLADKVAWLGETGTGFAAIIAVDVWKTFPFMVLILLAGLQAIPVSLHEAARVDGASAFRRFWSVTLPLLRPALLIAVVFRTLDALRVFDVFFVMKRDLHTLATYNHLQLIDFQNEGYGSAVSVVIFMAILAFTIVYARLLRLELE